MRVYENRDDSLYTRTGRVFAPETPSELPTNLLHGTFESEIRATVLAIVCSVRTTCLAISSFKAFRTSNSIALAGLEQAAVTANMSELRLLKQQARKLVVEEMKRNRAVEAMRQEVIMLRFELAEFHELNGSAEDRKNDDLEAEEWMPNVGLSRRREEAAGDVVGRSAFEDQRAELPTWVGELEYEEVGYDSDSETETETETESGEFEIETAEFRSTVDRMIGQETGTTEQEESWYSDDDGEYETDGLSDEDEDDNDDIAPFENPVAHLEHRYQHWIRKWQHSENRSELMRLMGAFPAPSSDETNSFDEERAIPRMIPSTFPSPMASEQLPPYDGYRPYRNRWEHEFGREFEDNSSIDGDEHLDIKIRWECDESEHKKSIDIDDIYDWVAGWF